MNRKVLLLAVSLLASTAAACAAPTETPSADVGVSEDGLSKRDLAKAVADDIDENGTGNMTEIGRAGLKAGSRVLTNAQAFFDELEAAYADYGTPGAFRFGTGANVAYVVYVDAGDEAGYAIRVYDKTDTVIIRGGAPSNSEPIEWTIPGDPVSPSTAAHRMALADGVKSAYQANGAAGMKKLGRDDLTMWGLPMTRAVAAYDRLEAELGDVQVFRSAKIGNSYAYVVEGTLDDTVHVFAFNEFDAPVLEGEVNGPGDLAWQYRGLIEE